MKLIRLLNLLCFFLLSLTISAQNFTINGNIRDKETNEMLVGVPVIIKGQESRGVSSDIDGKYSLTLPKGNYTLLIHYMGYEDQEVHVSLTKNVTRNIELRKSSVGLQEVVVSSQRPDENITAVQTGVQKLEINEINKLPRITAYMSHQHIHILYSKTQQFRKGLTHLIIINITVNRSERLKGFKLFHQCYRAYISRMPHLIAIGKILFIFIVPVAMGVRQQSYLFHHRLIQIEKTNDNKNVDIEVYLRYGSSNRFSFVENIPLRIRTNSTNTII